VGTYGGLVAVLFSALGTGLGIWPGVTLARKKTQVSTPQRTGLGGASSVPADEKGVNELGITPRELEILSLIAAGLSNREIAARLFVSENRVKTHSSRLFDKLGAKRRTQAVQLGKEARLIP
jgi:ATP/maltotriose-dependent transcriptional regulator MalT